MSVTFILYKSRMSIFSDEELTEETQTSVYNSGKKYENFNLALKRDFK